MHSPKKVIIIKLNEVKIRYIYEHENKNQTRDYNIIFIVEKNQKLVGIQLILK